LVKEDFTHYDEIPHFWQIAYSDILALANDPNTAASRRQYVCQTCLKESLEENIYGWYLHKKMEEGEYLLDFGLWIANHRLL
jgi:hypothetical protein